jgi:hypothetical protein
MNRKAGFERVSVNDSVIRSARVVLAMWTPAVPVLMKQVCRTTPGLSFSAVAGSPDSASLLRRTCVHKDLLTLALATKSPAGYAKRTTSKNES